MASMIMGSLQTREDADVVIADLEEMGYTPADISVISEGSGETVTETNRDEGETFGETITEGASKGALTGAAIGGVAGLLAGAGVFPALAGILIGGPIAVALGLTGVAASTLSGAATGALAGGLVGALVSLGVPEDTARFYEQAVQSGGVVLGITVRDLETADRVREIMEVHGANEIVEVDVE